MHVNILEAVNTRLFGGNFAYCESVSYRIIQDHQIVMAQPTDLPERPPAPVVWEAGQASPAGYVSPQASELHVLAPLFPEEEALGFDLWQTGEEVLPPVSAFSGET